VKSLKPVQKLVTKATTFLAVMKKLRLGKLKGGVREINEGFRSSADEVYIL